MFAVIQHDFNFKEDFPNSTNIVPVYVVKKGLSENEAFELCMKLVQENKDKNLVYSWCKENEIN